jgi:hypothetical protein
VIVAFPPPVANDVSVVSVQGASLAHVTGAGGATVLAAGRSGVVRVAVIRPPGIAAPGPIRLTVRKVHRVRWLERDVAGAPSGRPVPRAPAAYCRRFARGARRFSGPALGADPGTLMREVCHLLLRVGDSSAFTAQTGISVASGAPPTPTPVPTPTPTPSPTAGPQPTPTPTPAPLPNRTGTQLFEYSVHVARDTLAAGNDEIVVTNSGEDDHALAIRDAGGVLLAQTATLAPRSDPASLQVALTPGTYTLFCPLYGHEALGMTAPLTVSP